MKNGVALAFLVSLLLAHTARANSFLIKPDGTGDFPSIQSGLDGAAPGDTVLLAPGVYSGPPGGLIDWPTRPLTLKSQAGAVATTIKGYSIVIENGPGAASGSVVDGVTITNAGQWAILCNYTTVTIRNCVFSSNHLSAPNQASQFAVLQLTSKNTNVEDCTFIYNGSGHGPIILCEDGHSGTIQRCLFYENHFGELGVVAVVGQGTATKLSNNTIVQNVNGSNPPDPSYGALYIYTTAGSDPTSVPKIANNIVALTLGGRAQRSPDNSSLAIFKCNDFYGNEKGNEIAGVNGGANFSADPLFCSANVEDGFYIGAASPCAAAQSPCGELVGAKPVTCGQPLRTSQTGLGGLKAKYLGTNRR